MTTIQDVEKVVNESKKNHRMRQIAGRTTHATETTIYGQVIQETRYKG